MYRLSKVRKKTINDRLALHYQRINDSDRTVVIHESSNILYEATYKTFRQFSLFQ